MPRRLLGRLLAGFTLTELMVSITGGLFISIAVFLLARQASRFYQHESRVSTATMASIVGFERLRADIARAGFLASPNVRRDPAVCNGPVGNPSWPTYLSHMQSIWIQPILTGLDPTFAANGLAPESITMAGSYSSADQFEVSAILRAGTGNNVEVYLNPNSTAMSRNCAADAGIVGQSCLNNIFGVGRGVRIVDTAGRHQYGTIVQVQAGPPAKIVLSSSPLVGLDDVPAPNPSCGIRGTGQGSLVNVVNIVQYTIASLSTDPNYAAIYVGGPDYDSTRRELVRQELTTDGTAIDGTTELVSEYAVDLHFTLTVAANSTSTLQLIGGPNFTGWADDISANDALITGPQLIRAVNVRLSVRSREADRETGLDAGTGIRVGLGATGGPPYARVRSVDAVIALNSQLGVTWQ